MGDQSNSLVSNCRDSHSLYAGFEVHYMASTIADTTFISKVASALSLYLLSDFFYLSGIVAVMTYGMLIALYTEKNMHG